MALMPFLGYCTSSNLLYLNLLNTNNQATDVCAAYLFSGATLGFDSEFDAYKFGTNSTSIATQSSENYDLSINALPIDFTSIEVPISCNFEHVGNYELSFNGISSFNPDIVLELFDSVSGVSIVIGDDKYSFHSAQTGLSKRFKLKITKPDQEVVASIDDANSLIGIYPNPVVNNTFNIKVSNSELKIELYNCSGQLIDITESGFHGDDRSYRITEHQTPGIYKLFIYDNQKLISANNILIE